MNPKDSILEGIARKARRETAKLSGEFARTASEDKEEIMAEMDIKKWLAESCEFCLDD